MKHGLWRALCGGVGAIIAAMAMAQPGTTLPVSVALPGLGPAGNSIAPSMSADGRYVAFESDAPDVVPGDRNGVRDVFVTDRQTGVTRRLSVNSAGMEGNGHSSWARISADGRFVAFESAATILVPMDTNGRRDVFLADVATGALVRLSVTNLGVQGNGNSGRPSISADGSRVAFESEATNLIASDQNGALDVYIRYVNEGVTACVSLARLGSVANGASGRPAISGQGNHVAFESVATNLLPGTNDALADVFVRELQFGGTEWISAPLGAGVAAGAYAPGISADGDVVAFESDSTNLAPGDTNGVRDVFVRLRSAGQTRRVSRSSGGVQANGASREAALSPSGRYVLFTSDATNLVPGDANGVSDVFMHRLGGGFTDLVSRTPSASSGNGASRRPSFPGSAGLISEGLIVFESAATDLAPGIDDADTDVFLHAWEDALTERVSQAGVASLANGVNDQPSMTPDGRYVAFSSSANDLVPGDTNGRRDVFVRDMLLETTMRVSVGMGGAESNGDSYSPSISADGTRVAFTSTATNLAPGDGNGQSDVFVVDLASATTELVSVTPGGVSGAGASVRPDISGNGQKVAFASWANNLVPGDFSACDVFVRDLTTGTTRRYLPDMAGLSGYYFSTHGVLDHEGRKLAIEAEVPRLSGGVVWFIFLIFAVDVPTGDQVLVSVRPDGSFPLEHCYAPSISADGTRIAFDSVSAVFVPGDTNEKNDVFVRDIALGQTIRASNGIGGPSNGDSTTPDISPDGRFVAFRSAASNLVPSDVNATDDVFLVDLADGATSKVSVSSSGAAGFSPSTDPTVSTGSRFVAFTTQAADIVEGPWAGAWQVLRHEREGYSTTVSGTVVLSDFIGPRAVPEITFELVPTGGGATVTIGPVALGAGGTYSFATSATGTFDLYAKASTFLRRKYAGTIALAGMPVNGIALSLMNGDVDGSNRVDLDDFLILAAQYELTPPTDLRADLNGDEAVNLDDFLILAGNYEIEGD